LHRRRRARLDGLRGQTTAIGQRPPHREWALDSRHETALSKEVVPITDRFEGSTGPEEPGIEESRGPADPSRPEEAREPPTQAEIDEEIGREITNILEESYGRGAESAQAIITDGWVIVLLDGLELLPNEQFLVDRGNGDAVAHVRSQYQMAIQGTFRAAIERATGRRVIGFASTTSVAEPRFMAEIFKLD